MLHHSELNLDNLKDTKIINTRGGIEFFNIEAGFDIETSSVSTPHLGKAAFMYIWQFGIGKGNPICYGRTWEELLDFLSRLRGTLHYTIKRRLVIYIHNLGYEFQFFKHYFLWDDVFALDERKPVKAITSTGIEFRDSMVMSGYSLQNTAKNLTKYKVEKMVGDLDYSLIRHSQTPLTPEELKYCENDIEIILSYIKEEMEQAGDITKLPLTNTGRVRKYVKNNCYYNNKSHKKSSRGKYNRYRKIMNDLTLDAERYTQLKRGFMGGFTHSNPIYTNQLLKAVDSVDLTSSYPTVMLADKFPMSKPIPLQPESISHLKEMAAKYCIIMDAKFVGLKNKIEYESYLSESKCYNVKDSVNINGRIFEAEELVTTITEVDLQIIEQVYSWDELSVSNVYGFHKGYLPKAIITSILDLYADKTTLKGVDGAEVEYLRSKGMLNSIYGMCVTDIVKDEHTISGTDWVVNKVDVDEKITDYNDSKNRFLYYPWGIWVTAYARRNLWSLILAVGGDYIYADTDSVKMFNYDKHLPAIDAYNKNILNKLETMAEHLRIDKDALYPKSKKGEIKPLGIWEHEGHYTLFKTLGAKRYLLEHDGKLELTVAGLSKANGLEYMLNKCNNNEEVFNMFSDELYIPETGTGKMTHTYIDNPKDFIIEDYLGVKEEIHSPSSIHLGGCDFTLSMSEQFKTILDSFLNREIIEVDAK